MTSLSSASVTSEQKSVLRPDEADVDTPTLTLGDINAVTNISTDLGNDDTIETSKLDLLVFFANPHNNLTIM